MWRNPFKGFEKSDWVILILSLATVMTCNALTPGVHWATAIGVVVSELYGGMPGVTTAGIIFTGIFANIMGSAFCRIFRLTDPIARGVALGTAGHVIGTARANEMDPLTGAVSSLSLVVAGLLTAIVLPLFTSLF